MLPHMTPGSRGLLVAQHTLASFTHAAQLTNLASLKEQVHVSDNALLGQESSTPSTLTVHKTQAALVPALTCASFARSSVAFATRGFISDLIRRQPTPPPLMRPWYTSPAAAPDNGCDTAGGLHAYAITASLMWLSWFFVVHTYSTRSCFLTSLAHRTLFDGHTLHDFEYTARPTSCSPRASPLQLNPPH